VEIETLEIHSHDVKFREIRDALEWAAKNSDLLMKKFKEYNP